MDEDHADAEPSWIELRSIKPLGQVKKITSLSEDTLGTALPPPDRKVEPGPSRHVAGQNALAIARGEAMPAE